MGFQQLQPNIQRAATLLKAMSNERRLMVLCHISEGERSVGELEKLVGLSQSALSQHLARLRRDGLVATRRSAQTIYYRLNGIEAETVIEALTALYGQDAQVAKGPGGKRSDKAETRAHLLEA